MVGISPDTFSAYVARGQAPRPTQKIGRTPLWDEDEISQWAASRPGRPGRPSSNPQKEN